MSGSPSTPTREELVTRLSELTWTLDAQGRKQDSLTCAKAAATLKSLAISESGRTQGPGRRVVCAAIRAADGELLLGVRHYSRDMHQQIEKRVDGAKFKHRHDEDQGFVDQHGVWMDREEAHEVAHFAGQIVRPEACGTSSDNVPRLYSEGIY